MLDLLFIKGCIKFYSCILLTRNSCTSNGREIASSKNVILNVLGNMLSISVLSFVDICNSYLIIALTC